MSVTAQSSDGHLNRVHFRLTRVLDQSAERKTIFLLGRLEGHEGEAVLLVEKQALAEDVVQRMVAADDNSIELSMQNDIYGLYTFVSPLPEANKMKMTLIFPATQRHIDKYSKKCLHLIHETPEDYQAVTLPFIRERCENLKVRTHAHTRTQRVTI